MARSETWVDARFRSAIARQDKNKTGLVRSGEYVHICDDCSHAVVNENPQPPRFCDRTKPISGVLCTSSSFTTYESIHVEAMPIGRVITDHRKRGQRGW